MQRGHLEAVNGSIEVSVSDTGVGIAPEDPGGGEEFKQVGMGRQESRRHRFRPGPVTQIYRAARRQDLGQSQIGAGSTFTFTVPVLRRE
jgi:hypothetical protein